MSSLLRLRRRLRRDRRLDRREGHPHPSRPRSSRRFRARPPRADLRPGSGCRLRKALGPTPPSRTRAFVALSRPLLRRLLRLRPPPRPVRGRLHSRSCHPLRLRRPTHRDLRKSPPIRPLRVHRARGCCLGVRGPVLLRRADLRPGSGYRLPPAARPPTKSIAGLGAEPSFPACSMRRAKVGEAVVRSRAAAEAALPGRRTAPPHFSMAQPGTEQDRGDAGVLPAGISGPVRAAPELAPEGPERPSDPAARERALPLQR